MFKGLSVYVWGTWVKRCSFVTSKTKSGGAGAVKGQLLAATEVQLVRTTVGAQNVIPIVTTKNMAIEHTHREMRKEFKYFTAKKSLTHVKAVMQEKRDQKEPYKADTKQMTK